MPAIEMRNGAYKPVSPMLFFVKPLGNPDLSLVGNLSSPLEIHDRLPTKI
jgi:hypothetical protein